MRSLVKSSIYTVVHCVPLIPRSSNDASYSSLNIVIERSQVMMSNGMVWLKPCRTNLTFMTQLLFLAKSHKPGRPIFTYSLFLSHSTPLFLLLPELKESH